MSDVIRYLGEAISTVSLPIFFTKTLVARIVLQ